MFSRPRSVHIPLSLAKAVRTGIPQLLQCRSKFPEPSPTASATPALGQQLRAVQARVPCSQKPSNVNTGIRKMGLEAFGGFASNYRSVPDLVIQQHHSHFPPCSIQLLIAFAHLSAQFFISRLCLINPAQGSSTQNTQAALSSPVPSAEAAELKLHRGISP